VQFLVIRETYRAAENDQYRYLRGGRFFGLADSPSDFIENDFGAELPLCE
jgi:hypothetical protein